MTGDARRLLQTTWPDTEQTADALARRFYARLFEIDPGTTRMFASAGMDAQRAKLVEMLRWVVDHLDAPEVLVPTVAALARRHAHYGVHERHYDAVGEALRDALAEAMGDRFTPAVRDAWSEAYALLAGVMKRAAAQGSSADGPYMPGIGTSSSRR